MKPYMYSILLYWIVPVLYIDFGWVASYFKAETKTVSKIRKVLSAFLRLHDYQLIDPSTYIANSEVSFISPHIIGCGVCIFLKRASVEINTNSCHLHLWLNSIWKYMLTSTYMAFWLAGITWLLYKCALWQWFWGCTVTCII